MDVYKNTVFGCLDNTEDNTFIEQNCSSYALDDLTLCTCCQPSKIKFNVHSVTFTWLTVADQFKFIITLDRRSFCLHSL